MRIIIVDDEPLARERLKAQILDAALGSIVGEADNGEDAIRAIHDVSPDVVLLDIRMPGMDGIETARHLTRLPQAPAVIFTTAYDEHALAAFDANAIDYLLKPIRATRLQLALEKARRARPADAVNVDNLAEHNSRTHISGTLHGDLALVSVDRIRYFQAGQGYVDVVWDEGSMLIEESLRSLEAEFAGRFIRVHRNSLVALVYITGLNRDTDGNHVVLLDGCESPLAVSRRLAGQVRSQLR